MKWNQSFLFFGLMVISGQLLASGGQCRWEGGTGASASCKIEDCARDGGSALCTNPTVTEGDPQGDAQGFTYNMCDEAGPYISIDVRWCAAAGGTWGTDSSGQAGCFQLPAHVIGGGGTMTDDESLAVQITDKFEGKDACGGPQVTDSGWGKGSSDDEFCWAFNPVSKNGLILNDRRERLYSGMAKASDGSCSVPYSSLVVLRRDRSLSCPAGYAQRERADGDYDCVRPPPCPSCKGDPVEVSSGARIQHEVDWTFGDGRGLRLERTYYSFGYYQTPLGGVAQVTSADDVWRTNYGTRLFPETAPSLALATVVRPDGSVISFDSYGVPLQKYSGYTEHLTKSPDGTWTLTTPGEGDEKFDSTGRLTSIVSTSGQATMLQYDSDGKLGLVQDFYGRTLTFQYTSGKLSSVTLPSGSSVSYQYDSRGRLIQVTYPDGATRKYGYSSAAFRNLLTSLTDESGVVVNFHYDAYGRATDGQFSDGTVESFIYNTDSTSYTDASGSTTTMAFSSEGGSRRLKSTSRQCAGCTMRSKISTFDDYGNKTSSLDANGHLTTYEFSDPASGLETSRTEGLAADGSSTNVSRTISTTWSTSRKPLQVSLKGGDGSDATITYGYDQFDNITDITAASGDEVAHTTVGYDSYGRLTMFDGPRTDVADITRITYFPDNDPCIGCRGQPKTLTDALGQVTNYNAYNDDGRLTRATDPGGMVTFAQFDLRGRVLSTTFGYGASGAETVSVTYDASGRVLSQTTPDGVKKKFSYDSRGRSIGTTMPSGEYNGLRLDGGGRVLGEESFDQAGLLRTRESQTFNGVGDLVARFDGNGNKRAFGHDAAGNITGTLSALGHLSQITFDSLNRQASNTAPDGGVTSVQYNALDEVTTYRDPSNIASTYAYTGLGRLKSITSPDSGTAFFYYDTAGNLVARVDGNGARSEFTYDALNRLIGEVDGVGSANSLHTTFQYGTGTSSELLTEVLSDSAEIEYTYNTLGRLLSESISTTSGTIRSTSYTYVNGRVATMRYPSGMLLTYQYDQNGRISDLTADETTIAGDIQHAPFGAVSSFISLSGQTLTRTYDLNRQVIGATLGPSASTLAKSSSFIYDPADRLIGAQSEGGISSTYSYDLNGNRLSSSIGQSISIYQNAVGSNRVDSVSSSSGGLNELYQYDSAGNVVVRNAEVFGYDSRNVLVSATGPYSASYSFDGLGRRIRKSLAGLAVDFVYGSDRRILGQYASDGTSSEEVYLEGIPVSTVRIDSAGNRTFYVVYSDEQGTPRRVADSQGIVRWEWMGEPFGATSPDENPSGVGPFTYNLRFSGQFFDAESTLSQNNYRSYDAMLGRYTQYDPSGLPSGGNPYVYANSNPLSWTDTLGLATTAPAPAPAPPVPSPGVSPAPSTGLVGDLGAAANDAEGLLGRIAPRALPFCARLAGIVVSAMYPTDTSACDQPHPPSAKKCFEDSYHEECEEQYRQDLADCEARYGMLEGPAGRINKEGCAARANIRWRLCLSNKGDDTGIPPRWRDGDGQGWEPPKPPPIKRRKVIKFP